MSIKQEIQSNLYVRLAYPTEQFANEIGCKPTYVNTLRRAGIIQGTKVGRGYVYSYDELMTFLEDYKGYDLANLDMMIVAKMEVDGLKANQSQRVLKRRA